VVITRWLKWYVLSGAARLRYYGRCGLRGRTETTTWNTKGMVWEIALFWGLERDFCHGKKPSKKKVTCRLRGTSCSCTAILVHENGSLRLERRPLADDMP
jgi:hypothetical protein